MTYHNMNVGDEIYDVVDEDDRVIGQANRRHIHENRLLHRSVHIFVFNSQNKLFLQKRSTKKDENPKLWDTSSAGHVDKGESYDACAHRELFEELGLKVKLKKSIKFPASEITNSEHIQVYTCITDDAIKINLEEISEGAFFEPLHIQNQILLNPNQFTPSFRMLFAQINSIQIRNFTAREIKGST